MVDLQGPGVLWRVWSAMPREGHIRVYLDGGALPAIDKPFRDFFGDHEKEYPGLAMTLSRGRNAFVPIPFAKACKVVLFEGWGAYFHSTHTQFPAGTDVETFPGFTPEVKSALERANEAWSRRGASPYAPAAGTSMRVETLDLPPGGAREMTVGGAGAVWRCWPCPLSSSGCSSAAKSQTRASRSAASPALPCCPWAWRVGRDAPTQGTRLPRYGPC
jgi:hypothetical protein